MKILHFANTEWYLFNFRLPLAIALRDAGHEVLLVSPPGPYGGKLRAQGFRWIEAPMARRSLNPLRELALVSWLRRLIVREGIDLVHGFTIKCAVYGSLAGRLARIRGRVNAIAGMGYVFSSGDVRARVLRPLVRTAMGIALGGEAARLILQNQDDVVLFEGTNLVRRERIRLIQGSGVNCSRFTPRPRGQASESTRGRFRVVLPARLLWDKGLAEYVEAARLLRGQGRAIDLLVAGESDPGNPAAVPASTLRTWAQEGAVQCLGHVDDMPSLLRSVDAVVLPSYREGLPKGLIEGAACGLPLVATDVPGCREVVTDDVDGLLVSVQDPLALATAIARLQDDPALCARLGAAAREKALAKFDERLVIERTIAVYRELIPDA